MTDQKIRTTQDMIDDHYEEVEALQRENSILRQELDGMIKSFGEQK